MWGKSELVSQGWQSDTKEWHRQISENWPRNLQQLRGKADPFWQSNKQSYYLQKMHVNAYKSLFEHSIFITLTYSTSHPQTLHVSFPFSTGPTDNGTAGLRQEMPVPTEMPSPTSPALAWRLSPIPIQQSWLSMRIMRIFFILVNCKTPIYCSQIIVTSPDQTPPNGGDCKGNGTFYFRELTRLVKYDLLARI